MYIFLGSGSSNAKLPSVQAVASVPEDSASHMRFVPRLNGAKGEVKDLN